MKKINYKKSISAILSVIVIITFFGTQFAYATPIRLIQKNIASEGGPADVSFTTTPHPGNTVVVAVTLYTVTENPFDPGDVTDNQGNTYRLAKTQTSPGGDDQGAIFYASDIKASGTYTVSYVGGGSISIYEYEGISKNNPLDKISSGNGSSNNANSGNITTNIANELYFGVAWSIISGDTWAANNGFVLENTVTDNDTHERHAVADKVGPAQTTSADFSIGVSSSWLALVATFKPEDTENPTSKVEISQPIIIKGNGTIDIR